MSPFTVVRSVDRKQARRPCGARHQGRWSTLRARAVRLGLAAVAATWGGSGCGSSQVAAPDSESPRTPPHLEHASSQPTQKQSLAALPGDRPSGPIALLGARHDVGLKTGGQPNCRCLAVRLFADPNHSALSWEEQAPRLAEGRQWVVALSSEGLECAGRQGGDLGASYRGYRVVKANVIVDVEALAPGRPRMSGAIIPAPAAGGRVYVEPSESAYGGPINGSAKRCEIELPTGGGQPREP